MSLLRPSPVRPSVDYDRDGVQHGFLRLPYSRDDSAWGAVLIPITVIRNGEGPTALLTGGNHGDEYEGPIALLKLASSLQSSEISGRVIIVPAMNHPAFRAGRRTSPIDGGNLNRSFPGRPDGSVTEKIADYFQRVLLPLADIVLDHHAGGRSLDFLPFAAAHELPDKEQEARCIAAMEAFNAPYGVKLCELDAVGMYDTAAEELGKTFVTTELGGGGTATARSVRIADRGVRNLLVHAGILRGEIALQPTVRLAVPGDDSYVISTSEGVLEMCRDLGQEVAAGEPVARVYPPDRTGIEPVVYHARMGGLLVARHFPGLIKTGDCLAVIAVRQG
ncbi:MAG TPA: N(2)-acetyl-L-2,4-diaminobutanoate deacetylase DoeB [Geminicoccaceae bacterium]|nr:N(2)-acetyl-L-2,4-diaminobutanoate deacetylase DoeB [Geminicoccaceae bacterium]